MLVVVAGGTGFIGRSLASALVKRGDQVVVFTRNPEKHRGDLPEQVVLVGWNPKRDGAWQREVEGADALVSLTGESLVGRRYTERFKKKLVDSRVGVTARLVAAIEKAEKPPRTFVCGSAIGYYGVERGVEPLDEEEPPGKDFLAQLCVDWEAAASKAEARGVRVVNARIGIALGSGGVALEKMSLPFYFFVGGKVGSGEQMVSWIHIEDLVGILVACIDDESIRGAVNATAPEPASNAELARSIGRALKSPAWLPVPGFAVKLLFGEGAEPVLGGHRVIPMLLSDRGFEWRHVALDEAVSSALDA
jgi:uncharacterized protein (TIGR01777 family)